MTTQPSLPGTPTNVTIIGHSEFYDLARTAALQVARNHPAINNERAHHLAARIAERITRDAWHAGYTEQRIQP